MSTAAGTVEITDAQRARAAANKAAALARRAAREAQTPPPPQPPPSANSHVLSHFVPRASVVRATEGRHAPQHMPSTTTTTTVIAPDRMRRLNFLQTNLDGGFVLLWVQSAQRARHNETLEYAAQRASALKKPLVAVFAGTGNFPHANERHLGFMYDGLCELRKTLENTRNITLLGFCGDPGAVILRCSQNACEVVVDGGYTKILRKWRKTLAQNAQCVCWEVESEVVSPVYSAGGSIHRAEKAAATLRPKIWARLGVLAGKELLPTELDGDTQARASTWESALSLVIGADSKNPFPFPELPLHINTDACLDALDQAHPTGKAVDRSVKPCDGYHRGGEREAHRKMDVFFSKKLEQYSTNRNNPGLGLQSHLSPYVHYGQISVVYLTHKAMQVARGEGNLSGESSNSQSNSSKYVPKQAPSPALQRGVDKYLDELVIRRELAVNFVLHEKNYDTYLGIPQWARNTLQEHSGDARKYTYTLEQFEHCETHDVFWNACQREIVVSGKMHNYVRMFWCKKIIEWSSSPHEAWEISIHLNNKYGLDGRDPVSFTGVGWCFGLHDKPFPEAQVTGATRRMSENGMRSKFRDGIESYVRRWGDSGVINSGKRRASTNARTPGEDKAGGRQMRLKEMFGKKARTE
ncbi:deoxyribodipyrimidine photo-lyase [bacterium]|nr:deoxyribodipyrimidine photo-lyase [bacterium]